jgi:hypothetical protein
MLLVSLAGEDLEDFSGGCCRKTILFFVSHTYMCGLIFFSSLSSPCRIRLKVDDKQTKILQLFT